MHLYHLLQRIGLIPYSLEDIDKYYIYKDILKKYKKYNQHQVEIDSSKITENTGNSSKFVSETKLNIRIWRKC